MDVKIVPQVDLDLTELIEVVNQLPDFPFFLEIMLDRVSRKLGVESAGVMLYDPVSNRLELQTPAFGIKDAEKIEMYSVSLEDGGNAVEVFTTGKPYYSNHALQDTRFIKKYIHLYNAKTAMTVPLIVSGRHIGVLHLHNKQNCLFSDQDLHSAITCAEELAILIEQSQSFIQMAEREKEARALYQIGLMISQGSPIEWTLQSILSGLHQCIEGDGVGYCLFNQLGEQVEGRLVIDNTVIDLTETEIISPALRHAMIHAEPMGLHLNDSMIRREFQQLATANHLMYGMFVPLTASQHVSGLLFVLKKRFIHFSSKKLEVMKRFSQQASLALQNHYLTKNQAALIEELKQMNHRLVYSSQIHAKLVQLVLDGGEFNDLAIGIQELLDRKIYLFDENLTLLSDIHSLSIDLLKIIDYQIKQDIPFLGTRIYESENFILQISASTDGKKNVGYVVMAEEKDAKSETEFNRLDRVVLEQAAIVLALRKMQRNMEMEIEGRMILNWLDDVLIGDMPDDVLERRGKTLGYDPERFNCMLLIHMKQSMDQEGMDKMISERQSIYNRLRHQMHSYFSNNFVTTKGNILTILLETRKGSEELPKTLFQGIRDLFPNQVEYGALMQFGGTLDSLRQSYQDGEKILSMMGSIKKRGLVSGADLRSYQFFLRSHNHEYLKQFYSKMLAPLLQLSSSDREMWLETLSVFLETSGEIKATAELLHIHKNTLLYRLRKLEEILSTDLKNPAQRFDLQLACRLFNMFEGLKKVEY